MADIESLKTWLQHRIDYWEGVCEKHPNDFEKFDDIGEAWAEALERGEDDGMLSAFYQVQEFLQGQRR